jgi:hypothetical protein
MDRESLLSAFEVGYKYCEEGLNYQAAEIKFKGLIASIKDDSLRVPLWLEKALCDLLAQWYQYASLSGAPGAPIISNARALTLKKETEKILKSYRDSLAEISSGEATVRLPVDKKGG